MRGSVGIRAWGIRGNGFWMDRLRVIGRRCMDGGDCMVRFSEWWFIVNVLIQIGWRGMVVIVLWMDSVIVVHWIECLVVLVVGIDIIGI